MREWTLHLFLSAPLTMLRTTLPILLLPLFLAAAAPPPLEIGGTVLDSRGLPVAGATAKLVPVVSPAEEARLELAGVALPPAVASARTDAAGRFALTAAETGLFRVVVEAPGAVPAAFFLPAVESVELPLLRLTADAGLSLRVLDEAGRPVAGARVGAARKEGFSFSSSSSSDPWEAAARRATTGEDGRVRLPRGGSEALEIRAVAPGRVAARFDLASRQPSAELRLTAGCPRGIAVRDASGKPVAGVLAGADGIALAVTDPEGRATIDAPCKTELGVSLRAADGRQAALRLPPAARADPPALPAVLPPAPPPRPGRLLEAGTRRPVAAGLVWTASSPGSFVRSDAQGGYRLPAGFAADGLTALAAGYSEAHAELSATGAIPTLLLPPTATLAGRVVDRAGHPLAGVGLQAATASPYESEPAGGPARARSGAAGTFRLRLVPLVPHKLQAEAAGFAPAGVEVPPLLPHAVRSGFEVVLSPGRQAFGRVLDGAGEPVAGAEAELAPPARGIADPLDTLREQEPAGPTALADGEGRFTLLHVAAGRHDLTVRAPGFAATVVRGLTVPAGDDPFDLGTVVLQPGLALAGVVVDSRGRPVAGAHLRLWTTFETMAAGPWLRLLPAEKEGESAADGTFRFADLAADARVAVAAERPGFVQAGSPVQVTLPQADALRLVLTPAARALGRVVDERGNPLTGAVVIASRAETGFASPDGQGMPESLAQVDGEGRFTLGELPPGRFKLSAHARGFLASKGKEIDLGDGGEVRGIELVLEAGAAVEGRVLTEDGKPVDGAEIEAVDQEAVGFSPRGSGTATTDGDGRFLLSGLEEGTTTLTATHRAYLPAGKEVTLLRGATARLEIRLREGLSLSGRVVDARGLPVAARVTLEGDDVLKTERAAEDGSFSFAGLRSGTVRLTARKEGAGAATLAAELAEAPLSGIELRLAPEGAIVGRITGVSFAEISRLTVWAGSSNGLSGTGEVDFDGNYRIPGVTAGTWHVLAGLAGGGRSKSGSVEVPADGAEVRLDLAFGGELQLAGRVRLAGEPLADAFVAARRETAEPGAADEYLQPAMTDAAGRFRLDGLEPGSYRLQVMHMATATSYEEPQPVPVTASRDDLEIDIPEQVRRRLLGRVLDRDTQAPLAGARIFLNSAPGEAGGTDADGVFRLSHVAPGHYRVSALKEGYSAGAVEVEVGADADPPELRLELAPGAGLTLAVSGPAGAPPREVFAALLDAAGHIVAAGTYNPGPEGRFRLSQAPAGPLTALVSAPNLATLEIPVSVPGPAVALTLPAATLLAVEVPALAGEARGGTMTITAVDGRPFRSVSWGGMVLSSWPLERGGALVADLPPGSYVVRVTAADGRIYEGRVVANGQPLSRVLE